MKKQGHEQSYAVVLAGLAFLLLLTLSLQVTSRSLRAETGDALNAIRITPAGPLTVEAGGSLRLTAEGDYGTAAMPVRADWTIVSGQDFGSISQCSSGKTCTFLAGEEGGEVEVRAESQGKSASAQITIEAKKLINPFKDDLPSWASEAIIRMHGKGIIKGYEDGRFGPADPLTRGQVSTLLSRMLRSADLVEEPVGCLSAYADVPPEHYAFIPVCLFARQDWIVNARGADFRPDDEASRGETAAFMNRAVGASLIAATGIAVPTTPAFEDIPASHPFFRDIAVMNALALMTGYPNGDFGGEDSLNRAAAAVVMDRALQKIESLKIKTLQGYAPRAGVSSSIRGAAATSSASSKISALPVASSSSSSVDDGFPPLPSDPSGAVREQGTITLSYQSWTTFDFDAGQQNAPVGAYDMSFPHRNTPFEVDVQPSQTKIMLSPKPYTETSEADCLTVLRKARQYTAIVPSFTEAVCFQTKTGLIGKVSNGWPYGNVQYEIWGWTFLPEYQPGETPY